MNVQPKRISYRIARRAGHQGARPSVSDQAEVEKLATDLPSQGTEDGNSSGIYSQQSPPAATTSPICDQQSKAKKHKWTREEYKEVMLCYYKAQAEPMKDNTTKETYRIWRQRNPNVRPNMDANKIASQRRYIEKNKKLTAIEIDQIKAQIEQESHCTHDHNEAEILGQGEQTEGEILLEGIDNLAAEANETSELSRDILNKYADLEGISVKDRPPLPKLSLTKKMKALIKESNSVLEKNIQGKSLNEINQLLYATAFVISDKVGKTPKQRKRRTSQGKPKWQIRIEKQIEKMRGELSLLTEMLKEDNHQKKSKKRSGIKKRYNIKTKEDMETIRESLKMKIQAKAQRLRRYDKRSKQYNQNRLFNKDRKKFYRSLGKEEIKVENPPSKEEIEQFWRGILGEEKHHDDNAHWITREEEKYAHVESQTWDPIMKEEVHAAIRKSTNWKSPGIDAIPNFWLKQLTATHNALTTAFNKAIENPEDLPEWFTTARTFLLPKSDETDKPKNYRPIACLPTLYKVLTSIISERSYKHILDNDILPEEQKGCARNSYGCKDQLLTNKAIIEDCKRKKKNLSVAWIDYRKAYDSVPHSWILKTLSIYKFNNKLINFMEKSMKSWNTTMYLNHVQGSITTEKISIKQGIFQGDSLSPLLFCLALVPLTSEINASGYGYKMNRNSVPISNLFYMDDLKLYAPNDDQQQGELRIVKQFSDDIKMSFGLDKCAKASFKKGKLISTGNIELDKETTINELDQDSGYRYLGVDESDGIQHTKMKEKIRKEYYRRVRLIVRSELNGRNKIEAINSLAIPTVQYSFGIIDWKYSELKKLDSKTRKILTMHGMLHPKSDVDRIYIPRKEGGRGLIEIETAFKVAIVGLNHYLENKSTLSSNMIIMHEKTKPKYSISKMAKNIEKEMADLNFAPKPDKPTAENAKVLKQKVKEELVKKKNNRWLSKPLHGKYPSLIGEPHVDLPNTNNWLRSDIKGETEGLLIAAQDQALYTRNYQKHIVGKEIDSRCRMCYKQSETIDHITSGCEVLAKSDYIERHNKAAAYVHWNICNDLGIKTSDKWYEHQPDTVTNTETHTVLWDMAVHTDRHIGANRPDIIIKDKLNSTCKLIDMTVPCDKNVSIKEIEKKSKYKDLEIEIQRMWKMKTEVIPIVIGALGTIRKGMEDNIRSVSGNLNIQTVQKTCLLGTARILRKVLSI